MTARRKGNRGLTVRLCAAMLTVQFILPVTSRAEGKQKVRVGYVSSDEFLQRCEEPGHDHYEGYMAEFLEVMSIYGDWEYEFISGSWDECQQWIADGTIDLLPGAMLEDAGETVSLSELPLTTVWDNLYVPAEAGASFGEYDVIQNKKIGCIKGGYSNEEFFRKNNLNCELVVFDNYPELEEALNKGTVSATMGIGNAVKNRTLLARISPRCIYMGFSNRNPELKEKLESAYEQLMMEMPDLIGTLQKKYVGENESDTVLLSQVEQAWIAEHPTVRVAYIEGRKPHEYETETGKAAGIHVQFLEEILNEVGLKAEWVSIKNTAQALSYLDNGLVDVVTTVCANDEMVLSGDILVTNSYRDSFFSVLGKKGTNLQSTGKPPVFAVEKGTRVYMDFIKKNYPDSKILRKDTEEEVYAAIKSGEAKATVVEANMEEFYRLKYDMGLENKTEHYQGIPVCLGVKQSAGGQLLISILNQGIQSLDAGKVNALIINNNDVELDYSFIMILKKYRLVITCAIILVLLFGTTVFLFRRRYQRERLWRASYIDKVTGRGNYEKMMLDAKPLFDGNHKGEYGVCALDIVKFKNLNEAYGYSAGNKVLEVMAQLVSAECKEGEFCARAGGDQFVMILKGGVTEEHIKRMEKLVHKIEQEVGMLNSEYRVRCVAGVYLLQEDNDPYYAIDKANLARKTARDSRSRNVAVYDVLMHKRALKEREIESIMYQALADDEFLVYLQPRVKIDTGEIVAAEALVRWQRKNGEMIYPDTFIPLFEANGFIREMDFYVYEKVCQMLRERLEKKLPVVPVSVNVSRAHLVGGGDFLANFNELVNKYEIPQKYLELELTESLLVENPAKMIETVNALKANRYTVSIDDFGSGYSSLNILKQLHFDILKIDKEFLRIEGAKPEDKIILESVIHMAKKLQMQVLVEGVEVEEQQQMLTKMGCDFAQGYYFSRPVPMEDFLVMLEKQNEEAGNEV